MWGIGWSFISFAKDAPTRASELRGILTKSMALSDVPTRAIELRGIPARSTAPLMRRRAQVNCPEFPQDRWLSADAPTRASELRGIPAISTASTDMPTSAAELPGNPTISTAFGGCANACRIARYAILRLNAAARMNRAVATSVIAGPEGRFR